MFDNSTPCLTSSTFNFPCYNHVNNNSGKVCRYIVVLLILQPPVPFPLSRRVQCSPQHPVHVQYQQTFHIFISNRKQN